METGKGLNVFQEPGIRRHEHKQQNEIILYNTIMAEHVITCLSRPTEYIH
jgi:hypothetical protein